MSWSDAVAVAVDSITRFRALAAAVPGAGSQEVVLDAPYEEAWARISDLETSVPAADPHVHGLRIHHRRRDEHGVEHLRFVSTSPLRLPVPFTARLEDGFCVMRSIGGVFVVVMAARPEGDGRTRFGHLEAVPRRWAGLLRPMMRRNVGLDVEGFRRVVEGPDLPTAGSG